MAKTKQQISEEFGTTWATIGVKIYPIWLAFEKEYDTELQQRSRKKVWGNQLDLLYEYLGKGKVISKTDFAKKYGITWQDLILDIQKKMPELREKTPFREFDKILFPSTQKMISEYIKPLHREK